MNDERKHLPIVVDTPSDSFLLTSCDVVDVGGLVGLTRLRSGVSVGRTRARKGALHPVVGKRRSQERKHAQEENADLGHGYLFLIAEKSAIKTKKFCVSTRLKGESCCTFYKLAPAKRRSERRATEKKTGER